MKQSIFVKNSICQFFGSLYHIYVPKVHMMVRNISSIPGAAPDSSVPDTPLVTEAANDAAEEESCGCQWKSIQFLLN